MPAYTYLCESCGSRYDIYQSIHDAKQTECRVCGRNTLERLIVGVSGLGGEFKAFFDPGTGEQIWNREQIKERERKGLVMLSNDEISREAKKNKEHIAKRTSEESWKKMKPAVEEIVRNRSLESLKTELINTERANAVSGAAQLG